MNEVWESLSPEEKNKFVEDSKIYLDAIGFQVKTKYLLSFSSCAIEGNKLGEYYAPILRDYIDGKPVEDLPLVGLALTIRNFEKEKISEILGE